MGKEKAEAVCVLGNKMSLGKGHVFGSFSMDFDFRFVLWCKSFRQF